MGSATVYYLANSLLLGAYAAARVWLASAHTVTESRDDDGGWLSMGISREKEVAIFLALIVGQKWRRALSAREMADKLFLFGKCATCVLLWWMDKRAFAWCVDRLCGCCCDYCARVLLLLLLPPPPRLFPATTPPHPASPRLASGTWWCASWRPCW